MRAATAAMRGARRFSTTRDYDIVLFGATGFAGRLAAEYALRAHPSKRIAFAGRDAAKLEALKASLDSDADVIVADAADAAGRAPPRRDGRRWIALMAHEHDGAAKVSGATLVPASGFDSVPSDLGCQLAVRRHVDVHGAAPTRVDNYVTKMRGAFQGGTIDTVVNEITNPTPRPPTPSLEGVAKTKIDWAKGRPFGTVALGGTTRHLSPFIMAGANCPVVRRSNAALNYADGLIYSESMALPSLKAAVTNAAALGVGGAMLRFAPTRNLLRSRGMLPESGAGPSRAKMLRGSYAMSFVTTGANGETTVTRWNGAGDPSCISTTVFLVETAVALAEGAAAAPGVLTPASALGAPLLARLRGATWGEGGDAPVITVDHGEA
ncbi:oxidoreductase [Aureococcus anophagefferens]|nr:oxidoreductase [Aureococcus anophagefferens]